MGRIVSFIRAQDASNVIYRIFIQALAILISFALCLSIIGTPLLLYGFKEYIVQMERARFDHLYVELHSVCTEHAKHQFLKGRLGPLDEIDVKLRSSTRQQMIRDLKIKPEKGKKKDDIELLRMAAVKYADFFVRYHLTIYS